MFKVGITGGIGSGKSTVAKIFGALGIPCYQADLRAKKVIERNASVREAIIKLLGNEAYHADGKYNAPWVSKQVFNNQNLLQQLNAIVHPAVGDDFEKWLAQQKNNQLKYILKEAALLFEAGTYKTLDAVILVKAPLTLRMHRLLARDKHRTEAEIMKIINSQWSDEQKQAMAQFVVENDEQHSLIKQVLQIHQAILQGSGERAIM